MEVVFDTTLDEKAPILKQLVLLVDKVNALDVDAQAKLMEWVEKKFKNKAMEKATQTIAIQWVEISTMVMRLNPLVQNLISSFKKLSNIPHLTQEIKEKLQKIGEDMKQSVDQLTDDLNNMDQRGRGIGKGPRRGGFLEPCFHCREEGHRAYECHQC